MAEEEFTAFLNDAESRRVIQDVDQTAKVHRGTVRNAARACRDGRSSDIMLVDLDGEQNPISHVAALLQVCRPESVILATGSENNVALANDLYRGGIFLYLPKPLDAVNLRNAIREVIAVNEEQERPQIQASRVVLVHGKGMGVNTVMALMAHLAAGLGRYVSCLDLDANFGSLSLAFDTQPERGLAQVLQDPDGADGLAVERLQARVTNRIGLLAHSVDQAGQGEFHEGGLDSLIKALSSHAHLILVCGASMEHLAAMRHLITNHIIVFEPTPAGVSIATRWLRILEGATSALILNHARPLPNLLASEQLRNAFADRLPDVEIPYLRSMSEAMALGEPERAITRRERESLNRFLQTLLGVGAAETDESALPQRPIT